MYTPHYKNDIERDAEILKLKKWAEQFVDNQELMSNQIIKLSDKKVHDIRFAHAKKFWMASGLAACFLVLISTISYMYLNIWIGTLFLLIAGWLGYIIIQDIREKTR